MGKISKRDFSKVSRDGSKLPATGFKKPEFLRAREKKERVCLMCREPFLSTWSGARICSRCKKSAAWRNALSEA